MRTTKNAEQSGKRKTLEIDVAAIHHVERARLGQNFVEDVDVVQFAFGNADKRGDAAAQVQQRVHLDSGFVLAEPRPRKQRQTEVDGGQVQRVQTVIQIDADRVVGIQRPRHADQHLGKVRVDAPIARRVGVGQRRARRATAEPRVIEFAVQRTKARFDVPQAFAVSHLREGHRQILIPTRELPQTVIALVTADTTTELSIRKEADQL